jgi:hypothetical protein
LKKPPRSPKSEAVEHDLRSGSRERTSDAETDPGGRAGHYRDPAFKSDDELVDVLDDSMSMVAAPESQWGDPGSCAPISLTRRKRTWKYRLATISMQTCYDEWRAACAEEEISRCAEAAGRWRSASLPPGAPVPRAG